MIAEYTVVQDSKGFFRLLKYNEGDNYIHLVMRITADNKEDAKSKFREMGYNV